MGVGSYPPQHFVRKNPIPSLSTKRRSGDDFFFAFKMIFYRRIKIVNFLFHFSFSLLISFSFSFSFSFFVSVVSTNAVTADVTLTLGAS